MHAQPPTARATFRTSAQMVLVPVTVTDRDGKSVNGLRQQDFSITDDQKPQEISSFTSDDAPCSVGLVVDVSGSMKDGLSAAKKAAHEFLKAANPDDEFLLLTVSTLPEAVSEFTADTDALERKIELAHPDGFTALIDTVYLALSHMREARQHRKALLVLSDGVDNHSRYSKGELMRVALEADVQVYTIILGNPSATATATVPFRPSMIKKPGDQAADRQGPLLLEELANRTGGLHFRAVSDSDAKDAAIKASQTLRNQYVIGYQPPNYDMSGKWHRVHVKSSIPKVNVYARSGYYSR